MNSVRFSLLLTIISTVFLSGCSQKSQVLKETLSTAFFPDKDAIISPEYLESMPYARMFVGHEGHAHALLVLGFAETNQSNHSSPPSVKLKWFSNKQEMLITENGRLIKTVNLKSGDLTSSHALTSDPLLLGLHKANTPKDWSRHVDWSPDNYFNVQLDSTFTSRGEKLILVNDRPVSTLHFIEHVNAPELSLTFTNEFWIHPSTGRTISSIQHVTPFNSPLELTVSKDYPEEAHKH